MSKLQTYLSATLHAIASAEATAMQSTTGRYLARTYERYLERHASELITFKRVLDGLRLMPPGCTARQLSNFCNLDVDVVDWFLCAGIDLKATQRTWDEASKSVVWSAVQS